MGQNGCVDAGQLHFSDSGLEFGTAILEFGLAFGRDKIKISDLKFGTLRTL